MLDTCVNTTVFRHNNWVVPTEWVFGNLSQQRFRHTDQELVEIKEEKEHHDDDRELVKIKEEKEHQDDDSRTETKTREISNLLFIPIKILVFSKRCQKSKWEASSPDLCKIGKSRKCKVVFADGHPFPIAIRVTSSNPSSLSLHLGRYFGKISSLPFTHQVNGLVSEKSKTFSFKMFPRNTEERPTSTVTITMEPLHSSGKVFVLNSWDIQVQSHHYESRLYHRHSKTHSVTNLVQHMLINYSSNVSKE